MIFQGRVLGSVDVIGVPLRKPSGIDVAMAQNSHRVPKGKHRFGDQDVCHGSRHLHICHFKILKPSAKMEVRTDQQQACWEKTH